MSMFLSLAWRSIWRNRRRSLITISSVVLAVVLAIWTRGFQLGFYAHTINNVVSYFTGYIQIHDDGYWEKKSLNKSFGGADSLLAELSGVPHVTTVTQRLETFALISAGETTDGAMIIGIDPQRENEMSDLADKITEGSYLSPDDGGILLAEGLAGHLRVAVGDTVVVLGQGYHGITAAGKYEVTGLVSFPTPDLDNRMSYLTLPVARDLTGAFGQTTSLAVMIDNHKYLAGVRQDISQMLPNSYEVMTWKDMMPELVQLIQTDNASGIIMLLIIYMVIGFGILGTVLMMTIERTREFGVLMAVGMHRFTLGMVTILESIMLTFVGTIVGVIVAIPVLHYFAAHPIRFTGDLAEATRAFGFEPIMPMSLDPMIFFWQAVTVLVIALIAAIYPVWRISHIKAVTAIRKG